MQLRSIRSAAKHFFGALRLAPELQTLSFSTERWKGELEISKSHKPLRTESLSFVIVKPALALKIAFHSFNWFTFLLLLFLKS